MTDQAALPCHRRPSGHSSNAHFAGRDARFHRSHLPHRSARSLRKRGPHCGQSRLRGPSGWPVRTDAGHRGRGPPSGRSRRRPARRGSRSGRDSSRPKAPAACDDQLKFRDTHAAPPRLQNRKRPPARGHHRSGIQPLQRRSQLSRGGVARSRPLLTPRRSRRRKNAPAASGSNTSPPPSPDRGYCGIGIQVGVRQTVHCQSDRKAASGRGVSE